MKFFWHLVLCGGFLGTMVAETDEEWLTRRRRELLDEGKSLPEVRRILDEEKSQRAKNPPSPSPTPEPQPAPKTDTPPKNDPQAEAEASKEDELASLEAEWKAKLEEAGFKGSELEKALKAEMSIQKKILKLPEKEKASESNSLHKDQATELLKESSIVKGYPSSYIETLAKDWKQWLQVPSADQKKFLEEACKKLEQTEVQKRKAKSAPAMNETRRELKAYWTDKAYKQMPKAMEYFSSAWETLINTPAKEYDKAKSDQKEKLKRNGFDTESVKIFFKGMDPLFEEDK